MASIGMIPVIGIIHTPRNRRDRGPAPPPRPRHPADAVLDRLVHNAHRPVLKGGSLRRRAAKTLALDAETSA